MASPYVIGERVWVRYDDDWWPAKVINVEALAAAGLDTSAATPNQIAVLYYSGEGGEGSGALVDYDPDTVAPFETSSEKAVTTKAEIKAAIKAAAADDTAVTRPGAHVVHAKSSAAASAGSRRPRATTTNAHAAHDDDMRASSSTSGSKREELGDVEAASMEQRLSAAVASGDVAAARSVLLRAVRVATTEGQLRRTKVGRAVGSVLATPALQPLHALAKCVLRGWASAVPAATREALGRAQTFATAPATSSVSVAGGGVSSPLSEGSVGSPMSPSTRFVGGADAYFAAQVTAAFEKQNCHGANTPEAIAAFVAKASESLGTEFKRLLIKDIQMPDHDELRRNLLTGAVTLAQFTHFTAADHQPPTKRREDEARRLREAQELEEAKQAETNAAATDMFPCPKCTARAATYYEKQIRSADEPATTFLTCTKCKHQWTLN